MLMANAIPNKVLARILRSGKFVSWCKEMASVVPSSIVVNIRLTGMRLVDKTLSGVG